MILCSLILFYTVNCVCSDNPLTCCDADQVDTLRTNMKIPRQVIYLLMFMELWFPLVMMCELYR